MLIASLQPVQEHCVAGVNWLFPRGKSHTGYNGVTGAGKGEFQWKPFIKYNSSGNWCKSSAIHLIPHADWRVAQLCVWCEEWVNSAPQFSLYWAGFWLPSYTSITKPTHTYCTHTHTQVESRSEELVCGEYVLQIKLLYFYFLWRANTVCDMLHNGCGYSANFGHKAAAL